MAFIGISNWALDPAKMNRGVMVTRGDPDTNELVVSAHGICHKEENDEVRRRLSHYFESLASAYNHICENQKRQFFGLRDFYRYQSKATLSQGCTHSSLHTYYMYVPLFLV